MRRLADATIGLVDAARPRYDRSSIRPGIVHIGLGAFARAHLAVYIDDLLAAGHHDLGIIGVSLHHDDTKRSLEPQDWLYTLGVVDGNDMRHRVIGSIHTVLHAPSQPAELRTALATMPLVTVTVTEKGYCWNPSTRSLDTTLPDVAHDIIHPDQPRTLPGHLVLAARDRRDNGGPPVTVLSLDNLTDNGKALRGLVTQLAEHSDPTLARWIKENVGFPSSMVDRMVPSTDDEFRAHVAACTGLEDGWPVRAEPFSQWVLERGWRYPMPPLERVGVDLVAAVGPWESLKLEVLNALHTAAAHFGLRYDLATVDQVVADPRGSEFLRAVAGEIRDVVRVPNGADIDDYISTTMGRFANTGLGHRCAQIATDSSHKLPPRLLGTVRRRLASGMPIDALGQVIALWAWSTRGVDAAGRPRAVLDPLAGRFAVITADNAGDPVAFIDALLAIESIFGDLSGDPVLRAEVIRRYHKLG